ncbi:hypothetical protein PUR25_01810 [Streptomyces sp. JV181]|uniref:hypothetical protein n=1 Tax=Streptomyces sp. JV181 TaxID=858635 RepID=UPI002E75DC92|nr:hypothetical protein [Streptomyces sp. JV181]MEE1774828.1 hypothetical protein [Streptomyces sp. JV181]
MSSESFNWHEFLGRWQEEWVPRPDADEDENGGQTLVRPGLPRACLQRLLMGHHVTHGAAT